MKKILLAFVFLAFVTVTFGKTSIEAFKPKIEKTTTFCKVEVVKNVELSTPNAFVFKEVKQAKKLCFTDNNTLDVAVVQEKKINQKVPLSQNIYDRYFNSENYNLYKPIVSYRCRKMQDKIKMHRSNYSNWTC